jgi:hypothetical protein
MTDDEFMDIWIKCATVRELANQIEQRTIERCADVCEELDYPDGYEYASGSKQAGFDEAREDCSAAIRALKEEI